MKERNKKNLKINKNKEKAGVYKDIPWLTHTNPHLHDKKKDLEIRWRMIIIKQMSKPPSADVSSLNDGLRARQSVMRKHWILPCSLIKWWLDGVRGREDKQRALCPGTQKYCQTLQTIPLSVRSRSAKNKNKKMQTDCCFPVKSLNVYVKKENLESTKWHLAQNVID